MERTEFDKLVKRLGPLAVLEAIIRQERIAKGTPTTYDSLTKAGGQAHRLLFDSGLSPEDLWERFQRVSEPATVPRQTPRAGVTPGKVSENKKH